MARRGWGEGQICFFLGGPILVARYGSRKIEIISQLMPMHPANLEKKSIFRDFKY